MHHKPRAVVHVVLLPTAYELIDSDGRSRALRRLCRRPNRTQRTLYPRAREERARTAHVLCTWLQRSEKICTSRRRTSGKNKHFISTPYNSTATFFFYSTVVDEQLYPLGETKEEEKATGFWFVRQIREQISQPKEDRSERHRGNGPTPLATTTGGHA